VKILTIFFKTNNKAIFGVNDCNNYYQLPLLPFLQWKYCINYNIGAHANVIHQVYLNGVIVMIPIFCENMDDFASISVICAKVAYFAPNLFRRKIV
jgi:hypothetical protein